MRVLPRQSECNANGTEWASLSWPEVQTHPHQNFFIKDRIAQGDIALIHFPKADMIADFFTKSLQGKVFQRFLNVIMGVTHFDSLCTKHALSAPEVKSVLDKPD